MKSRVASLDDEKDMASEILGVSLPGETRRTPVAPRTTEVPVRGSSGVRSNVLVGGVAAGRAGKPVAVNTKRLTAIEKANIEADEERERFKAENLAIVKKEAVEGENVEVSNALKYERRLEMNRRSAAASRVRREAYVKALERHLRILEEKTIVLEAELHAAEERRDLQRLTPTELQNVLPDPEPPFLGNDVSDPVMFEDVDLFPYNGDLYR